MKAFHFSPDIQEFILLLAKHKVRYVIVGGEAVIYHGYTRLTGDVDFFYERSSENARSLYEALIEFWEGVIPGVDSFEEFLKAGTIIQFGVPPNRIDLLNTVDAVSFEEAWKNKIDEEIESGSKKYPVYFIGVEQLIKNKMFVKRFKDMEDLKYLQAKKEK